MSLDDKLKGFLNTTKHVFLRSALGLSLTVMPAVYNCGEDGEPAKQYCTSDYDCKEDRVCIDGECAYPQGKDAFITSDPDFNQGDTSQYLPDPNWKPQNCGERPLLIGEWDPGSGEDQTGFVIDPLSGEKTKILPEGMKGKYLTWLPNREIYFEGGFKGPDKYTPCCSKTDYCFSSDFGLYSLNLNNPSAAQPIILMNDLVCEFLIPVYGDPPSDSDVEMYHFSLSQDKEKMVFLLSHTQGGIPEVNLWLFFLNSKKEIKIDSGRGFDDQLSWHPNNQHFLYTKFLANGGLHSLILSDLAGNLTEPYEGCGNCISPYFSKKGDKVIFDKSGDGIYSADFNGKSFENIKKIIPDSILHYRLAKLSSNNMCIAVQDYEVSNLFIFSSNGDGPYSIPNLSFPSFHSFSFDW